MLRPGMVVDPEPPDPAAANPTLPVDLVVDGVVVVSGTVAVVALNEDCVDKELPVPVGAVFFLLDSLSVVVTVDDSTWVGATVIVPWMLPDTGDCCSVALLRGVGLRIRRRDFRDGTPVSCLGCAEVTEPS